MSIYIRKPFHSDRIFNPSEPCVSDLIHPNPINYSLTIQNLYKTTVWDNYRKESFHPITIENFLYKPTIISHPLVTYPTVWLPTYPDTNLETETPHPGRPPRDPHAGMNWVERSMNRIFKSERKLERDYRNACRCYAVNLKKYEEEHIHVISQNHVNEAGYHIQIGNLEAAESALNKALDIEPNNFAAKVEKIALLITNGKDWEAEECFRHCITELEIGFPNSEELEILSGMTWGSMQQIYSNGMPPLASLFKGNWSLATEAFKQEEIEKLANNNNQLCEAIAQTCQFLRDPCGISKLLGSAAKKVMEFLKTPCAQEKIQSFFKLDKKLEEYSAFEQGEILTQGFNFSMPDKDIFEDRLTRIRYQKAVSQFRLANSLFTLGQAINNPIYREILRNASLGMSSLLCSQREYLSESDKITSMNQYENCVKVIQQGMYGLTRAFINPQYETSEVINLSKPEPQNAAIFYINGMCTTKKEAIEQGNYISSLANDHNVTIVYNGSQGFLADGIESLLNLKHHAATEPVTKLHESFDKHFSSSSKPIVLICHSQGAILAKNALASYDEEKRKKINVLAVAPGGYIDPDLCQKVLHLCSKKDIVPLFDRIGRKKNKDTIISLEPDAHASLLDHSLFSPTYQPQIKLRLEPLI